MAEISSFVAITIVSVKVYLDTAAEEELLRVETSVSYEELQKGSNAGLIWHALIYLCFGIVVVAVTTAADFVTFIECSSRSQDSHFG